MITVVKKAQLIVKVESRTHVVGKWTLIGWNEAWMDELGHDLLRHAETRLDSSWRFSRFHKFKVFLWLFVDVSCAYQNYC